VTGTLGLGDPAARDPGVVGAKAARLAAAAAEGFPVLPGAVIPLDASASAIVAGARALAAGGRAAAYLEASRTELAMADVAGLARVASPLVVRSSTPFDDDGRWSGAFASYLDVGRGDVSAAVRGCWASPFAPDALERSAATGTEPAGIRVAVLAQPWVRFAFGGTASLGDHTPEAGVRVTAARGGAHGVVGGAAAATPVPDAVGRAVASLARRIRDATGVGRIEWGVTGERVVLLQVGPAAEDVSRTATDAGLVRPVTGASVPESAAEVAAIVARFRGPLADELVLPWALGAPAPIDAPPIGVTDPPGALSEACRLAAELTAGAWGDRASGVDRAAAAVRDLRTGELHSAMSGIAAMALPDLDRGRRVVGLLLGIGEALEARGVLAAAETVWRLTPAELEAAIAGTPPTLGGGPDRWEPFLVDVAFALGGLTGGTPIAEGVGAGRLHVLTNLRDIGRPGPRAILVAPAPLPQLAPLLWHCAGFVAAAGSAGAHLFEVARSLNVPAVIGVTADELGPPGSLVAVDGTAGVVASLGSREVTRARRPA